MIYKTGADVTLINSAEYCKSIIADGKELITGNERGEIYLPELKDGNVFIIFKENLQSLKSAFSYCWALTTIPENLFANCPKVTNFQETFAYCQALTTIPENLFANCPKVTNFQETFSGCGALTSIPENLFANCPEVTGFYGVFWGCWALKSIPTGLFDNNRNVANFSRTFNRCAALADESPYTMIGDKKVHLYERANYPDHFATPTEHRNCFYGCVGLSDYAQIPSDWQ